MKGNISYYQSGLRSVKSMTSCSSIVSTPDELFRERSAINTIHTESHMEAWVCCANDGNLMSWQIELRNTPDEN
jgi:hypothetical protein